MERLRDWSWRIALLLLPWQMRWFQEGSFVGGLPWEQGRLSVYLSWIPIVLTIFFACARFKESIDDALLSKSDWSVVIGMLLLALPAFVSMYPQASWQWLTQVMLLAFFAWSLWQLKIGARAFLGWSVVSIVPHAILAVWQYGAQEVVGSKWLGIAAQNPVDQGVSVVEVGARRVLRAYGGFPHPNILGGWLAYGLVALGFLASQIKEQKIRRLLAACAVLFSIALIFTFSRSAWISAAIVVAGTFVVLWRKAWTLAEKTRLFLIPIAVILAVAGSVFLTRDVIAVRAQSETRLEMKSVDERSASLAAAWKLVGEEWWLGQGQNTAILALDRAGFPIIPPHFVFLLILLETGILGSLGVALLLARWLTRSEALGLLSLGAVLPLALLDHYPWSIWAGQSVVMLFALLPFISPFASTALTTKGK
jgi:O-antigen ligase